MAKRPEKFKQVPENRPYRIMPDKETGTNYPKRVGAREEVKSFPESEKVDARRIVTNEPNPREGGKDTGKAYK